MALQDYVAVTEISGDEVSREQVERMFHRYYWAVQYSNGKDVLEVACGTGQGLGFLSKKSRSLKAGDYSGPILEIARSHYGDRIELLQFDAQKMPFTDKSMDVVILFEAIYYIPSAASFVNECKRVLRPGGKVLLATANKDLFDFNPSPHTFTYFGVKELKQLFQDSGFETRFFGYLRVDDLPSRQKLLRPLKRIASRLGLIPKTMAGKKFLKRFVFGKLVKMPFELTPDMPFSYTEPTELTSTASDRKHKVIYCEATLLN